MLLARGRRRNDSKETWASWKLPFPIWNVAFLPLTAADVCGICSLSFEVASLIPSFPYSKWERGEASPPPFPKFEKRRREDLFASRKLCLEHARQDEWPNALRYLQVLRLNFRPEADGRADRVVSGVGPNEIVRQLQ